MRLRYLLLTALWLSLGGGALTSSATIVNLYAVSQSGYGHLYDKATGKEIDMGEGHGGHHTLDLAPGTYTFSQPFYDTKDQDYCSVDFKVGQPEDYGEKGLKLTAGFASVRLQQYNSETDGYWLAGVDYRMENVRLLDPDGNECAISYLSEKYKEGDTEPGGFRMIGFTGYTVEADFVPTDKHPDYLPTHYSATMNSSTNVVNVQLNQGTTFSFSFPADATGTLTYKKGSTNYVPFVGVDPERTETADGITTYYYTVPVSSQEYCYRVTRPGCITRAGLFTPNKITSIAVTDEELNAYTNRYCAHDVTSEGNGVHYADIFLNINKRGLLRMQSGKDFQIVNLRTWQLTNNSTANYFVEPEYTWTVLNTDFEPDNSVVEIDGNGMLTAKAPGTAIVQVRYDALSLDAMNGSLWDEIWAENTGTFVVTVDADADSAPDDNIHLAYKPTYDLDAEHDILYYLEGEDGYRLTFTPAEGAVVTVANPEVDSNLNNVSYPKGFSADNVTVNEDGSVTALLTFGRNIIRTTDAAGNSNYQILSAKPSTLDLVTGRDDDYVLPGDGVTMQFGGLFHVAGKLASIYNSNCHIKYGDVTFNDGVLLGTGQYDFAGNAAAQQFYVTIPATQSDDVEMTGGCLNPQGYGSSPGAHRAIRYDIGLDPNFNAGVSSGQFGSLPEKSIHVTQLADVDRLKVTLPLGSRACPVNPEAIQAAFGENAHWVSPDESVVRIGDNGEIFPVSAGQVTISIASDNATRDAAQQLLCDVTVPQNDDFIPVTGVSLSKTGEYEIRMNGSWGNWGNMNNVFYATVAPADATNKRVRFTSSNPEIVAVGKKGQGVYESTSACPLFWNDATTAPGESLITVETLDGGYKQQLLVRWMRGANMITMEPAELTLMVGETTRIDAVPTPEVISYPIAWATSDPAIATVDEDGYVTGVAVGDASITASTTGWSSTTTSAKTNVTVVPADPTAVDEVTAEGFSFAPNPCHDFIKVTCAADSELEIFSFDGKLMLRTSIEAGVNGVDMSILPAGIYLMRVDGKTHKLIKK